MNGAVQRSMSQKDVLHKTIVCFRDYLTVLQYLIIVLNGSMSSENELESN
jgi:hypothetical protein